MNPVTGETVIPEEDENGDSLGENYNTVLFIAVPAATYGDNGVSKSAILGQGEYQESTTPAKWPIQIISKCS